MGHAEGHRTAPPETRVMAGPHGHVPAMRYEVVQGGIVHRGEHLRGHLAVLLAGDAQPPFLLRTGQQLVAEGHPLHVQLLVAPRHIDEEALAVLATALDADEMHGVAAAVAFQRFEFHALLPFRYGEPSPHGDPAVALHFHQHMGLGQAGADQQHGLPAGFHGGAHRLHMEGGVLEAGVLHGGIVQGEHLRCLHQLAAGVAGLHLDQVVAHVPSAHQ